MVDYSFVIYGAASDVVAPIFERFTDADFICLVNKSKPDHLKGKIIETSSDSLYADLAAVLSDVPRNRMIIFLNAAIYQKDELFISHEQRDIKAMINTGITQAVLISQYVLTEMVKRRQGRIINLSSFRAKCPANGAAVYAAIKSFGNTFFSALGIEYGRFDITSNSIAIGFAESKLLSRFETEKLVQFKKASAKNRFLPQEDFLDTLEFIINSKYLNSAIIDLDGGLSLLS